MEHFLNKGDLVTINGNVLHSIVGHPMGELQSIVFSPFLITGGASTAFYKKYIGRLTACSDFTVWKTDADTDSKWFLDAFSALKNDTFAYEFTVRENLSHLLLHCYAQMRPHLSAQTAEKHADTIRIEKMLQYIQDFYAEPIPLTKIANAAG